MDSSFTQFSYLSAAIDISCISLATYFALKNEVLNSVKQVARNEMIDAGQVDFRLAREAGELDSNGVIHLTEHEVNGLIKRITMHFPE
jgi:hypothetical protein